MKFLALDVGEKRIGVARGDSDTRIAIPVGFVETGGLEWQEIARTANFYGVRRFIVGLPRNNQGQETAQSAYAREFARQLIKQIPDARVKFQDETLTSVVAEERLKQSGRRYTKGDIDAEAAAIILQDYLDGLGDLGEIKKPRVATAPTMTAQAAAAAQTAMTPVAAEINAAAAGIAGGGQPAGVTSATDAAGVGQLANAASSTLDVGSSELEKAVQTPDVASGGGLAPNLAQELAEFQTEDTAVGDPLLGVEMGAGAGNLAAATENTGNATVGMETAGTTAVGMESLATEANGAASGVEGSVLTAEGFGRGTGVPTEAVKTALKTVGKAPETQNLATLAGDNTNMGMETEMDTKRGRRAKKGQKMANQSENGGKKGTKVKKKKSWKKKLTITMSVILVLGVLGVAGVAALKALRDHVRAQRAAEYAALEAQMQAEVFDFTIRPGETIYDVRSNLIAAGYSEAEADEALTAEYDFAMLRKRPEGASLEGYLFGETAEFYEDTSATEVIEFFLQEMQNTINENKLEAKFRAQGLSLHEGIILASVVQKEAKAADMPTVAQVFLTRLNEGMTLGSDVTVTYALDTIDPGRNSFQSNEEALVVDSCYNTRLYTGLPCGAIASPGLAALLAVAEPSDTAYLYFLTGDDGLMYYSYTEDEHLQNAAEHCQNLCQVSL